MPPVRWKLFIAVTLLCLTQQIAESDPLHESMPIASDGWRPIIGTTQREIEDEITLYKNPSQTDENSEPIKAQPAPVFTPPPTSPTRPYQTISTNKEVISAPTNNNINAANKLQGPKGAHHAKHNKPFIMTPNLGHGPHIPLSSPGHRGPPHRHAIKLPPHIAPGAKRHVKPVRGPMIAHSMKNEVIIPAPSAAIGTFAYINQGRGPPKGQGGKHFHIAQPHGHFEFANQFSLPGVSGNNDVLIQQVPVQTFLIQHRNPSQSDSNLFDEYTRNLVPPPYKPLQQGKEKQKLKPKEHPSVVTESISNINNPQLIIGKPKDATRHRTVVPENIIVQLPPSFGQQSQFGSSYNQQNTKDRDVEVQVTKEKLKVFHNSVPFNYNPNEDQYEQYNFQSVNKPIEGQKIYAFDNFQIIKEPKPEVKPPSIRKRPAVETFQIFEEPKEEVFKKPVSEAPRYPTYEVTESKNWQEPSRFQPFVSTRPSVLQEPLRPQPPPRIPQQPMEFVFLPTPYSPDGSVPTSPTQSDISTIYAELNKRNRPSTHDYSTFDPNFFSIKEVSTHYPIVGRPESPAVFSIPPSAENTDFSNEITAAKEEKQHEQNVQIFQPVEEPEPTNPPVRAPPVRDWQGQRIRPQRRRKPSQRTRTTTTTTTTTTEEPVPVTEVFEVQKMHNSEENYSGETYRPHRRRRPTRLRTTQATTTTESVKSEEVTRAAIIRQRHRTRYDLNRIRPTASAESIEEIPPNHKMTEAITYSIMQPTHETSISSEINTQLKPQPTEELSASNENDVKTEQKTEAVVTEIQTENYPKILSFGKFYRPVESEEEIITTEKTAETQTEIPTTEEVSTPRRRIRLPTTMTTITTTSTTEQPTVNIFTPENEIDFDYSTPTSHFEPSKETITIQEIYSGSPENYNSEATLATTTLPTTTSTTEATTTTKSHRVRGRPVKYDNKNRPRFSVKEYRQRLNQYSSVSTSTTEAPRLASTDSSRTRFPSRSRKPLVVLQDEEPSTERSKFTPKDPRHGSTNNGNDGTEKKINTRLRPFGRQRSTTETPTTPKLSIKPNIFSSLRRPPPVSLRQRIMNKYNRTTTLEKTTLKPYEAVEGSSEGSEVAETTITYNVPSEPVTEIEEEKVEQIESTNEESENEDMANTEIMKNDSYLLTQRVSDLTSSAHKEYETPGLFKSVSPNSRIVPNYFTISTDDPILPIEAFFPNIKDLNIKSDS